MEVSYYKNKNAEGAKTLVNPNMLNLNCIHNYLPTYNRFFQLNEGNYNSISLNNNFHVHSVNFKEKTDINVFNCTLINITNQKKHQSSVFIKLAPLLNPFKFIVGKYNIDDEHLFHQNNIHLARN